MVDIIKKQYGEDENEQYDFDVFPIGESKMLEIGNRKQLFIDGYAMSSAVLKREKGRQGEGKSYPFQQQKGAMRYG